MLSEQDLTVLPHSPLFYETANKILASSLPVTYLLKFWIKSYKIDFCWKIKLDRGINVDNLIQVVPIWPYIGVWKPCILEWKCDIDNLPSDVDINYRMFNFMLKTVLQDRDYADFVYIIAAYVLYANILLV